MKECTIALAVGEGTGPELADAFELTVNRFGEIYSVKPRVNRSPRVYGTYFSVPDRSDRDRISQLTREDAAHYEDFCREQHLAGVSAVFRTAINAQSLYLVRQRLLSVKIDPLDSESLSIFLVRDQMQGFYTGANSHNGNLVERTFQFSKDLFDRILSFALERARTHWGKDCPDQVLLVYKFHLFDGVLSAWADQLAEKHQVDLVLVQPDTANRNLLGGKLPARSVIVGSNEWADIMHAVLLDRLGLGPQEGRFSENVYLHPDLRGLAEYQTVHGSADDIGGKNLVNPTATVRAAAAIMQRHGGCPGAVASMERALADLGERGIATADLGGTASTTEVVDTLLGLLDRGSGRP
ncbi:isocitrate/isopropylmalate family dehydrogenase [Amycolatopsis sp. WGS_07]|uniref:isocitrate/isopropylmalate family dehydrogenase n=1 Tax=Amycolatopsis sp. WGS_07 TaxID=3076764 RepID=UPI0038737361